MANDRSSFWTDCLKFVVFLCVLFTAKIAAGVTHDDQSWKLNEREAQKSEAITLSEMEKELNSKTEGRSRFKSPANKGSRFGSSSNDKPEGDTDKNSQNVKMNENIDQGKQACEAQLKRKVKSGKCKPQSNNSKRDSGIKEPNASDEAKKLHDQTTKSATEGISGTTSLRDKALDSLDKLAPDIKMKDSNENALDMGINDKLGGIE